MEKTTQMENTLEELKLQKIMLGALSQFYVFAYYIDVRDKTFRKIQVANQAIQNEEGCCNHEQEQQWFLNNIVDFSFRDEMAAFTDLDTVSERLGSQQMIYRDYQNAWGVWVRAVFISAETDENGRAIKVLFIGQNIDASRRKEMAHQKQLADLNEQLRKANAQVQLQLDTVVSGISGGYFTNEDAQGYPFLEVSLPVAKNQGYDSVEEFIEVTKNSGWNNIWPADREKFETSFRQQLAQSNHYSTKYRVRCKDGHLKWVMDSGTRVVEPDGKAILRSLIQDIDSHERTNQMYLEERSRYREALLNDCTYAYTVDLTAGVLEKGYTTRDDKEFLPVEYFRFPVTLDAHLVEIWNQFLPINEEGEIEDVMSREKILELYENGSRNCEVEYYDRSQNIYVRVTILMSTRQEDGHVIAIIIGRDITSQKKEQEKAKQELEDANEKLKRACLDAELANASKTDFLARMSHDIRTPLNGILGLLEISKRCADDPQKVEDCRKKAVASANHLLSLLNDVLDMSKLESGAVNLVAEPFDMNDVLFQTHEIMEPQMREKKIHGITINCEPLNHPKVIGSPMHVRQILTNLISNAVKYNKDGGTIEAGMEEIYVDASMVVYRFTIKDTGIGMSEEFMQHIFEPFSREYEGMQGKVRGTGLGMAIVKKIVDKMEGTIEVQSRKDVGSTFIVTLPFQRDIQQKAHDEKRRKEQLLNLEGLRLLLVEDNELNAEVAQYLLRDEGAEVEIAYNGREATEKFAENPPHYYNLILMDMMMPVMDGCEATRVIRGMERDDAAQIPIIALTANAFSDDIEKCRVAGMNAHLSKPLNIADVKKVIRNYI